MSKPKRHNIVHETLTASVPPPKTWITPTYQLERYTVRRYTKTITVQLHGERGTSRRTESISFPLLPGISDADLVRAAVWFSPNKWTVPIRMNVSAFGGKFSHPVDERLLQTLMNPHQTATPDSDSQSRSLPEHDAPTLVDASAAQWHFQQPPPQAGQFQQFATTNNAPLSPGSNKRGMVQWYKTRSRRMKISLGCGTLIAVVLFFFIVSAAIGSGNTATPPATSTPAQQVVIPGDTPTPFPTATQPAATPTPKPTVKPTPTVIVRPTPTPIPPKPTPTPSCQAVNGNPWCYNFTSPGKLIYYPPASFCSYFNCIPTFQEPDDPGDGYIVQCADGMYSQSGGERGACSYHGGVLRPLYSH